MNLLVLLIFATSLTSWAQTTPINSTEDAILSINPSTVHGSFTRDMLLNCSFKYGVNSDFNNIMSIIVSKAPSTDENNYQELAAISSVSPGSVSVKDSLGARVTGKLVQHGLSSIIFYWKYPSQDVIGSYKCEAFGMDNTGHPRTSVAAAEVGEQVIDVNALVTKIRTLELNQDQMKGRLDESRAAMTMFTTTFKGHSYILTYPIWRNSRLADSLCRLYGGYLAEVNDNEELNYLMDFVTKNSISTSVAVLLGASDEDKEGRWVFFKSGNSMTNFKWASGAGHDTDYDCMSFRNEGTDDIACLYEDWNNFICELDFII